MSGQGLAVPAGACDSHVHVFPDAARYAFVPRRVYTPPEAPATALNAYLSALGLERVVIVQPSIYGTDNAALLDTIAVIGLDRARGVAGIDGAVCHATLETMNRQGVRGIRVNLEMEGEGDPVRAERRLRELAERIQKFGWHMQIFCQAGMLAAMADCLADLPVPIVLDHLGGIAAGAGLGQAGFDTVLALLKTGKAYVKASGAYLCSSAAPDFADVAPFAQAVIAANPDRILWGSNWPHPDGARVPGRDPFTVLPFLPIGDAATLNLLATWVDDPNTRRKILVDNPARLYGF